MERKVATGDGVTLLVVDDCPVMRAMIKRVAVITDAPIARVLEAANGAEALEILENEHVDVLFTDVQMPVMTGLELLREVDRRQQWPDLVRVIVSASGSAAHREEASALNVRCYVRKPFRREVMNAVLSGINSKASVG
jgi:two-component system, chemotaxis family, chemotaxis protein CheY